MMGGGGETLIDMVSGFWLAPYRGLGDEMLHASHTDIMRA